MEQMSALRRPGRLLRRFEEAAWEDAPNQAGARGRGRHAPRGGRCGGGRGGRGGRGPVNNDQGEQSEEEPEVEADQEQEQ